MSHEETQLRDAHLRRESDARPREQPLRAPRKIEILKAGTKLAFC
jgi:hypothetical protein